MSKGDLQSFVDGEQRRSFAGAGQPVVLEGEDTQERGAVQNDVRRVGAFPLGPLPDGTPQPSSRLPSRGSKPRAGQTKRLGQGGPRRRPQGDREVFDDGQACRL